MTWAAILILDSKSQKGGSTMRDKFENVLYLAELTATAILVAVPAIREIVSIMDPKSDVILVSDDEE